MDKSPLPHHGGWLIRYCAIFSSTIIIWLHPPVGKFLTSWWVCFIQGLVSLGIFHIFPTFAQAWAIGDRVQVLPGHWNWNHACIGGSEGQRADVKSMFNQLGISLISSNILFSIWLPYIHRKTMWGIGVQLPCALSNWQNGQHGRPIWSEGWQTSWSLSWR